MRKLLLLLACGAFLTGCFADERNNSVYSRGVRVGSLVKVSIKGTVNKSIEAQLNMGGLVPNGEGGAMVANVFEFSGPVSAALADTLMAVSLNGKRVQVYYSEYTWPMLKYDTKYLVDSVKVIP